VRLALRENHNKDKNILEKMPERNHVFSVKKNESVFHYSEYNPVEPQVV